MIENIEKEVYEILKNDNTGHNFEHALRVKKLALKFAKNEKADNDIIVIASLLHDVDDYKLVGIKNSLKLNNAKKIMNQVNLDIEKQNIVIDIIKNMGFKNSLKNIRPKTIEGKIVSDADLCDALGSIGIIRSIEYTMSDKGSKIIFDKNIKPIKNIKYDEYNKVETSINHMFEKYLKIPSLLLTKEGIKEGNRRIKIVIEFLKEFFIEEDLYDWIILLDEYLEKR